MSSRRRVPRTAGSTPPRPAGRAARPSRAPGAAGPAVRRVAGRLRAHAPAREELVAHQPVDDRRHALGLDDSAPEQMADVRAERIDAILLTVERERVIAGAVRDPERVVEASAQLFRLTFEPLGELVVAPHLTCK